MLCHSPLQWQNDRKFVANEEQLGILRQGVDAWNEWRKKNPELRPDLNRAKLAGEILNRVNFAGADLSEVDLDGAYLREAKLSGAHLEGAYLRWAYLRWADLRWADLWKANLSEADLSEADLSRAGLSKAILIRAVLSRADLSEAIFREADLSGAILSRADLSGADLSSKANLNGANLNGANLRGADLSGADLREAFLSQTVLQQCDLIDTNFEGALVTNTVFGDVDLSACGGLNSVQHEGPSILSVSAIIRSKGCIPEKFLRGVGLPDEWIAYIPSLVGEAIQFFSCFISYSSLDKAFAVRLYDALQAKGVRCWLDEKQLLPGDDISRQLERGIHLWDKFLLCASKNSLTSWWVENEIKTSLDKERTLQKEREKPVLKLIPLDLDGYMFSDQWNLGVFAKNITSRVAANFRGWDAPGFNFDEQVARVIRALRADEGAREPPPPSRL